MSSSAEVKTVLDRAIHDSDNLETLLTAVISSVVTIAVTKIVSSKLGDTGKEESGKTLSDYAK